MAVPTLYLGLENGQTCFLLLYMSIKESHRSTQLLTEINHLILFLPQLHCCFFNNTGIALCVKWSVHNCCGMKSTDSNLASSVNTWLSFYLNKKTFVFDKSISYSLVKCCNQAQKINTKSTYIILYCQNSCSNMFTTTLWS